MILNSNKIVTSNPIPKIKAKIKNNNGSNQEKNDDTSSSQNNKSNGIENLQQTKNNSTIENSSQSTKTFIEKITDN